MDSGIKKEIVEADYDWEAVTEWEEEKKKKKKCD